ncbi:MAG: type I-E CRISPR-associated endoribonuclease Cas2 [Pseudomonadota bacterium]
MVEVRSGVFLGNPSSRIREILWQTAIHRNHGGYSIQVWSDHSPQGFSYRVFGQCKAELVDFEGMCLVRRSSAQGDGGADASDPSGRNSGI